MARAARAFAIASVERYASLLINLGSTAVLSRLLTPSEFGIVVIGFAAAAVAEAVRELGGANYIVQTHELSRETLRCAFTMSVLLTLLIAPISYSLAEPIAQFYSLPQLASFLKIFALGFMLGPIASPMSAMMARNLAFGRRGAAVLVVTAVNAGTCVFLAMRGFSYMSFAWAYVASNAVSTFVFPLLLRNFSMLGVSFYGWRSVISFGIFGGAARLVGIAGENATYLLIGRFLSADGIGILFRAGSIATFPERVVTGGATAVALPVFSDEVRRGASVGPYYVRAVEMLTAIHWPALALIGLLAHPIVRLLLGPQWFEAAAYAQILSGAAMFGGLMSLNYPLLVAVGAIRFTPLLALLQTIVSLSCLYLAAPFGPSAVAWSFWFSVPINMVASIWLVRRVAPFSLQDLALRLIRNIGVTLATSLGPLLVIGTCGWQFDLPLLAAALATGLAGCGWIGGLFLSRHPLLDRGFAYLGLVRAPSSIFRFQSNPPL